MISSATKRLNQITFVLIILSPIILWADIQADFSASRNQAGEGVEIAFASTTVSTGGGPHTFLWNFGDGSPLESGESVRHKFLVAGTYTVTLSVKNAQGERSEKALSFSILTNFPPTADFSFKPAEPSPGQKVFLKEKAKDKDGKIVFHEWSVNGIVISQQRHANYIFSDVGDYRVKLRVIDNLGAEAVTEQIVQIFPTNKVPTITLEVDRGSLIVGQPVRFGAFGHDSDGSIKEYFWKSENLSEFVRGNNAMERIFPRAGYYRVSAKVRDNRGGEAIASEVVYVDDLDVAPTGQLEVDSDKILLGTDVGFILNVKGAKEAVDKVSWDFGDGFKHDVPGFDPKYFHSFNSLGNFTVSAMVIFKKQKSVTFRREISVEQPFENLLTVPNQVLLNSKSYIELVPEQTKTISIHTYDAAGLTVSVTSKTWSCSTTPCIVSGSISGSSLTLTAGTSGGTSVIKVTADGVDSQEITVVVKPFVNHISIAKEGEFFDRTPAQMYVAVDDTAFISYDFNLTYTIAPLRTSSHNYSDYVSGPIFFELPLSKSTMDAKFEQTNAPSVNYSGSKTGLSRFAGRNQILFMPDSGSDEIKISFDDNRFINLDNDFTISLWLNAESGYLSLNGPYNTEVKDRFITVIGNTSYQRITLRPTSSDSAGWTHIGLTYKASTRTLKGYRDGNLLGSIVVSNSPRSGQTPYIKLGKSYGAASFDEIRFWNRELTASEIKSELFTPLSLPSTSLLGSFSFDSGMRHTFGDDNGGSWSLSLSPFGVPSPSGNIIVPVQTGELDELVDHDSSYKNIVQTNDGSVEFALRPNAFSADEQLEVATYRCLGGCTQGQDSVSQIRLGPVVQIAPIPIPLKEVDVKLPFDSSSPLIVAGNQIKVAQVVYRSWDGSSVTQVLEPMEVNMAEGYVRFQASMGGNYWVTQPVGFDAAKVKYANVDIAPSAISYWGSRTFFGYIPASTQQFNLDLASGSSSILGVTCNGQTVSDTSFPITLDGLNQTLNQCNIIYSAYLSGAYLYYTDIFLIYRY